MVEQGAIPAGETGMMRRRLMINREQKIARAARTGDPLEFELCGDAIAHRVADDQHARAGDRRVHRERRRGSKVGRQGRQLSSYRLRRRFAYQLLTLRVALVSDNGCHAWIREIGGLGEWRKLRREPLAGRAQRYRRTRTEGR